MNTGIRLAIVLWILMAFTAIAQERGVFDVYDSGAKGDGLTNDTQSIQTAISNCFIYSGDDGICLKSFGLGDFCRNITITNCIISTNASGIKIGTETSGNFEDILIQNCVVYDTRQAAVGIMTVDGGSIERVTVSGIPMRNIKGAAIFIRLGNRNRRYRNDAKINTPVLRNILIENIQGARNSAEYACSISGTPGMPVGNIRLRNISLAFEGGLKAGRDEQVPEESGSYPSGRMFGTLPAYGFYIRNAKNISLENVNLSLLKEEERPVFVCEDAEGLSFEGLKCPGSPVAPQWIKLVNSRDVIITRSRPLCESGNYLAVYGDKSENIQLNDTGTEHIGRRSFLDQTPLNPT